MIQPDGKVYPSLPWQNIPELRNGFEVWLARENTEGELELLKAVVDRTTHDCVNLVSDEQLLRKVGSSRFYRKSGNQREGFFHYWWIAGPYGPNITTLSQPTSSEKVL